LVKFAEPCLIYVQAKRPFGEKSKHHTTGCFAQGNGRLLPTFLYQTIAGYQTQKTLIIEPNSAALGKGCLRQLLNHPVHYFGCIQTHAQIARGFIKRMQFNERLVSLFIGCCQLMCQPLYFTGILDDSPLVGRVKHLNNFDHNPVQENLESCGQRQLVVPQSDSYQTKNLINI
jgi:hypothetical protein